MLGGISQLLQDASHRPGRVEAERLPQRDALLARAALDGARGRVQRGISAFERAPQFLTGRNAVLPAVLPIRARPPRLGLVGHSTMPQSSASMSVWLASQPMRISPVAVFMVMHGRTVAAPPFASAKA